MSIADELAGLIRVLRGKAMEKTLVNQLEEMQARVRDLEAENARLQPRGALCKGCRRMSMRMVGKPRRDETFGDLGGLAATYKCIHEDCGLEMEYTGLAKDLP